MNKINNDIISKTFYKLLPLQIIIVAISSVNSIIDGMIATNLIGPLALSACGLFFPIIKLMETVNVALLGGAQILCNKYIGKNQIERARGIFSLDILSVLLFGLILSLVCFVFSRPLAVLFNVEDPVLFEGLCDYMRGYAPGIIAYLLVSQFTAFLQMENQEKRTYIGMALMIISNIAADIIFVSVLKMGLFGLGLATSVSNFIYVLVLLSYYITEKAGLSFKLSSIKVKDIVEIIQVGFPGVSMNFAQMVRSVVLNMIMLKYAGEMGLSAFSAVYTFGCLYYATTAGVANATRVLCSVSAGEEDRNALKRVMEVSVKRGVLMVSGVALVMMICSGLFTRMFYAPSDGAVYEMTRIGFLLFPITMPLSCICCIYVNYYQCRNNLKIANALSIIDGLIGVIIASLIFAPMLSMTGVWIAHIVNGLLCLLTIWIYTIVRAKKLPKTVADTMLLPDSFGVSDENRIDISIKNLNETVALSERVIDFCKLHQVDNRRSMFAGLCIEEMVGNIVLYGFRDGKNHTIDVRVVYKKDSLLIRIKDDCRMFNPKERENMMRPEDVTHNIGIRMVSRIARNTDYINSFGLNVLTIEI